MVLVLTFLVACGGSAEPTAVPPTEAPAAETETEVAEEPTEEPAEEPTVEPTVEAPAEEEAAEEEPAEEADEEMNEEAASITEIAAADGQFNTLVTALEAAGLDEVLADPAGDFTVFAPTDEAFAALPEGTVESLLEDPEGALTTVLLYHVVGESLTAEDVFMSTSLTTLQGEEVSVDADGEFLYLNEGTLVSLADIEASNGVIHVVDSVLLPPSMQVTAEADVAPDVSEEAMDPTLSIAEIAAENGNFSVLLAALDAAGLAETLAGEGAFTVFAPTDDAFAALPDGTVEALLEDPEGALTDILLYHVADGVVTAEQAREAGMVVTLQGEEITVNSSNRGFVLNGAVMVSTANISATNGIVHVIDAVLMPSAVAMDDAPTAEEDEEMMADEEMEMAAVVEYEIPGDAVYPEGVAYDSVSNSFFTDSTGDGSIFQGDLETGEVTVFAEPGIDGRTAAIGMAVDETNRRLWVAGGATQQMYAFDIDTGEQLGVFQAPPVEASFINDVIVDSAGNAYFTDSFRPELFVIRDNEGELGEVETFLDLTDTVVSYNSSFNVNGIVITADEQYLILNHSGLSALFRVEIATGEIIQIETDEPVGGDGMVLDGTTLYSVQGDIYQVELSEDYSMGEVVQTFNDASFIRATTIAKYGERLLVVNSQFNNRQSGTPELPFTITDMVIPEAAE